MGLINPDVYTTNQGIDKTNTYISFYGQNVSLRKNGVDASGVSVYEVSSIANIWWDQNARETNKSPIACVLVSKQEVGDASINESLYTILYAQLKVMFPNAYDSPSAAEPPQ
jgi:hypothetical protein